MNDKPTPAVREDRRALVLVGLKAIVPSLIMAVGEGVVGLIPALIPYVVQYIGGLAVVNMRCASRMTDCAASIGLGVRSEVSIVTVVFSGLALLSLLRFGPKRRRAPLTPGTYFAGIVELFILVISSISYAVSNLAAEPDRESAAWMLLGFSLLLSFYLAGEEAWQEAIHAGPNPQQPDGG